MMIQTEPIAAKVKELETDAEIAGRVALGFGHAALLAGLGAAGMAKDETEVLVNKMVERGILVETDAKKALAGLRRQTKPERPKMEVDVVERLEGVLNWIHIPTRQDLAALETKLDMLNAKVDALSKR